MYVSSNLDSKQNLLLELFRYIRKTYPSLDQTPFLDQQYQFMREKKPYQGLSIIHNTHITLANILKLQPLFFSGADVTVAATHPLQRSPLALSLLKDAGITVVEDKAIADNYDFCLDCCGGLVDRVTPKYGAVELTQSGNQRYMTVADKFPVITVDKSISKYLENYLGTGDGFLRAFLELTNADIEHKPFVVFGFGKVGRGVVRALSPYTSNITVVDIDEKTLISAKERHYDVYHISQIDQIKQALENSFGVVTATGVDGLISKHFDKEDFSQCHYLANIGSEDEYGDKFKDEDVLNGKQPINFSLPVPTQIRFLDPIFAMHNNAIDFIRSGSIKNGLNPYPKEQDHITFNSWLKIYNHALSDFDIVLY